MDFLEGALLGPYWSDTDYEDQPHKLLAFAYILLVYACVIHLFRHRSMAFLFQGLAPFYWLVGTLLAVVCSSFLASRYYRYSLTGRFAILGFLGLRQILATGFLISCFQPLYSLRPDELKPALLTFLDRTAGDFVSAMAERFRLMGLIFSGVILGILGFLLLLGFLFLLLFLPVILLRLLRLLQNGVDQLLLNSKTFRM